MEYIIIQKIASQLSVLESSVRNVIHLFDEGATIPFIARYRKEKTGSLDEIQIAEIHKAQKYYKDLAIRKAYIIGVIEEQEKLTPKLKNRIESTWNAVELEDIYLPYKRKRKTKAGIARSQGLEPLAEMIRSQKHHNIKAQANKFTNRDVPTIDEAIQGAKHIISEWISENEGVREKIRTRLRKHGIITSKVVKKKKEEAIKYKDYFDFDEKLEKCPSHRFLAIERGQKEGFLRANIDGDHDNNIFYIERRFVSSSLPCANLYKEAIEDSYTRLIFPSISSQIKKEYKEKADKIAIEVFTNNLSQLLLAPPLGQKAILALDPGFKTGCKTIAINKTGKLLTNTTIYPNPPQNEFEQSKTKVIDIVKKYNIEAIAIGNGTAGRETESFIKSLNLGLGIYMVNEDGASIYSASEIARNEFPDHDITVRGAVSIGRRLMDPLGELVKL
ncbi:MAG: Tex-like N-terminal domain-containing protein, partial [Saprospiraceae bacterium]